MSRESARFWVAILVMCSTYAASCAIGVRSDLALDADEQDVKPADNSGPSQVSPMRFEAATVRKVSNDMPTNGPMGLPGGRFEMQNGTVSALIATVYGMRIVNAPSWITSERYTIRAKAADGATREDINLMLRTLLAERFSLVAHQETRATQIYSLTALRNDKRPCGWLKPRAVPCRPGEKVDVQDFTPDAKPASINCGDSRVSSLSFVLAGGVTMSHFSRILSTLVPLGAPVVDNTGMSGTFDITLRYSTLSNIARDDAEWPSIFVALEEQLGLHLTPTREQRPVLVIDRIERPSEEAQ